MVLKGEFLERATLIPSGKHVLEGLWHRGVRSPAVLLIPPKPGEGSMDAAALNELAFALSRAGHASLRFNFGGVGASQGQSKRLSELSRDLRAAARLLRESAGVDEVALVAYRSGGEVALETIGEACRLVLISPTEGLDLGALAATAVETLVVLPTGDPARPRFATHCGATGDRLALVDGADPSWTRGLPQLGREVVAYLGGG
jgi:alpha/beta superfamily hydrolase